MDAYLTLAAAVKVLLKDLAKPTTFSAQSLQRHKIRADFIMENPPTLHMGEREGPMAPLIDGEVKHSAAVIVSAFLNPISVNWDYERFAEATKLSRDSVNYFEKPNLGTVAKPATVVDIHGRIILWYLPGLLLPPRVEELNRVTMLLREPLRNSPTTGSWRTHNFTNGGRAENSVFGAGRLAISIANFQLAHRRLEDPIYHSPDLRKTVIQQWLSDIKPVEQLLDAVLQIVHHEMHSANTKVTSPRLKDLNLKPDLANLDWPTVYPAMDIIANRTTLDHRDEGGANTFYDHLVNFGHHHQAKLHLPDLGADFIYQPGTSVLFSGKALSHSVNTWEGGERLVIAHYAHDDIHDRLRVARPALPTQLGFWYKFN